MAERKRLRLLGATAGLAAAPFIYSAVTSGESATHVAANKTGIVQFVDYQKPTNKGTLVFSTAASNKNTIAQPTMAAAESGNILSRAPWYDKIAVMALVESAGVVALAGQKRTHEASNLPTRWTAYAGTGLGIVAANVLAIAAVTGHI